MGRLREFWNALPKSNLKIEWPPVGGWGGMQLEVTQRKEQSPGSMSFLSDSAEARGRESIWPPNCPPFSSVGSERQIRPKLPRNHSPVRAARQSAQGAPHAWKGAFFWYPTSHENAPLVPFPFASPVFTILCLPLIVYTWPSVLEPGQGCGEVWMFLQRWPPKTAGR